MIPVIPGMAAIRVLGRRNSPSRASALLSNRPRAELEIRAVAAKGRQIEREALPPGELDSLQPLDEALRHPFQHQQIEGIEALDVEAGGLQFPNVPAERPEVLFERLPATQLAKDGLRGAQRRQVRRGEILHVNHQNSVAAQDSPERAQAGANLTVGEIVEYA